MVKKHVVIYYNPEATAEARATRDEMKSKGHSAVLIDASAFVDIEQADGIAFVGDISEELKTKIRTAYEPAERRTIILDPDAQSIAGDPSGLNPGGNELNGGEEVEIPDDWADMSWPEQQKLAAALTTDVVRTSGEAIAIIEEEVARREAAKESDQDLAGTGQEDDEETADEGDADDGESDDLDSMTKDELIAYAEEHEIDLGDAKKKADILAAIQFA